MRLLGLRSRETSLFSRAETRMAGRATLDSSKDSMKTEASMFLAGIKVTRLMCQLMTRADCLASAGLHRVQGLQLLWSKASQGFFGARWISKVSQQWIRTY